MMQKGETMRDIAHMKVWKEEENREAVNAELRNTPIDSLDLSNRPLNCLKRAGCRTVGDILKLMGTESGLKSARNLGEKSEAEIIEKLRAFTGRFEAGPSRSLTGQPSPAGQTRGYLIRPRGKVWYAKLEDFEVAPETLKCLHACRIYYVADLYRADYDREPGWKAVRDAFASIIAKLG